MTTLQMPQIIKRAERLPNGRIKGEGPPRLVPRVVKKLSTMELSQIQAIQLQKLELDKRMWRLLKDWGLNPKAPYRINGNGEVISVGNWKPIY